MSIGSHILSRGLQESLFPARVVYDLLFFFIVIIIVLNLIFGVIIDTFADLRSEKQKKEEILKTTCFICGERTHSLGCVLLHDRRLLSHGSVPPVLTWPALGAAGPGEATASSTRASRRGTWATVVSDFWFYSIAPSEPSHVLKGQAHCRPCC